MTGHSPWGSPTQPHEVWERWFAWRPILVDTEDAKTLVFWEEVWRRPRPRGGYDYRFAD